MCSDAKDYEGFQDSNFKKAAMDYKTDVTGTDKTYPTANHRRVRAIQAVAI
jgi:hypothetical protein